MGDHLRILLGAVVHPFCAGTDSVAGRQGEGKTVLGNERIYYDRMGKYGGSYSRLCSSLMCGRAQVGQRNRDLRELNPSQWPKLHNVP